MDFILSKIPAGGLIHSKLLPRGQKFITSSCGPTGCGKGSA